MSSNKPEDNRISGIWWQSDIPDKHVTGELFIDSRKLELNGTFEELKSRTFGGSTARIVHVNRDKTILGMSKKGKRYTLEYFDEPSSINMTMPGYRTDTYDLGSIFEGDHFDDTHNLSFERYYAEFPYLQEWVGDGVITTQFAYNKEGLSDTTITVHPPKTIEVYKNSRYKLSFTIRPNGVKLGAGIQEMNLSQTCNLKLEAIKAMISLKEANSIITHFERFLTIAVGCSISLVKYQASTGKGRDASNVTIYLRSAKQKQYSSLSIHSMNFGWNSIKDNSQTIFDKWFDDMDKYADIFNLFSTIRSDTPKILENQFKDIVSAIEGYVRLEKNNLDIDLDKTIKIVNEAMPKNDRPLVKADYNKIRITRNKLSHVAIKPEDELHVLDHEGIWIAFQKLLFLLEYSLLKNLGLSDSMLNDFHTKRRAWN